MRHACLNRKEQATQFIVKVFSYVSKKIINTYRSQ